MNNNYLVSFGLSVLSGFIHLNTNEIAQDRPIIAFLVGFVSLLFLTSIFTGISMLFKKFTTLKLEAENIFSANLLELGSPGNQ